MADRLNLTNKFHLLSEIWDPGDISEELEKLTCTSKAEDSNISDVPNLGKARKKDHHSKKTDSDVAPPLQILHKGKACSKEDHPKKQDSDVAAKYKQADEDIEKNPPSDSDESWTICERKTKGKGKKFMPKEVRPGEFLSRGKRMYERQSGSPKSGVKSIEKRHGGGAHNWGHPYENLDSVKEVSSCEGSTDGGQSDTSERRSVNVDPCHADARPASHVEKFSYDEWRQMHPPPSHIAHPHKLRHAGEGEASNKWEGMIVLKKSDETPLEVPSVQSRRLRQKKHAQAGKHSKPSIVKLIDSSSAVLNFTSAPRRGARPKTAADAVKSSAELSEQVAPVFDYVADFPGL